MSDAIRSIFLQRGYNADYYIDHLFAKSRRCHVYSLPFPMECMPYITHSLLDGVFTSTMCNNLSEFRLSPPVDMDIGGLLSSRLFNKTITESDNYQKDCESGIRSDPPINPHHSVPKHVLAIF
ncbi:unnamed protein product [Adineta ricciae]|uniref:Uncharacterized protein n=1 Tax=Adineta ricciae TaxID=249248 RepID=A0A815EIR3_ADIRI|nr:unnamed protein product [Adineta ricciae]CAF1347009.1 unnamed protein product [Adineta ricciae]